MYEATKRWRLLYPEKWRECSLANHRKRKYGLTRKQYQELLDAAEGKCQICKRKFGKRLHVDHCHKTNIVRGIICSRCNFAEGHLGTPEIALRMYQYMLKNELFYQGSV
jgi:hypothetical protein